MKTIGFVGAGNMARAMGGGLTAMVDREFELMVGDSAHFVRDWLL